MSEGTQEQHYHQLFEALADPAYIVDQETGLLLDVNPAAAQAYGYTRAELVGLEVVRLSVDPAQTALAVKKPQPVTLRVHKRKDGSTFAAEVSASVIDWGGRRVIIGTVRDVTVREGLKDDLRASKALLATAFTHSPLLMAISDLATDRYLEVNDAFCARIGFSREEMIDRTAVELGLVDEKERDRLAQELFAGRTPLTVSLRSKSGARLTCRYWGEVVHFAGGDKLFATAEDVTDHRQSDKDREEALSRLEKIASRVPGVVYQYRLRPDGSSCFPFASAAIREIYGVDPEEVQQDATRVFSQLHPEDLPAVVASIQASARDLAPWRHEYRVKFADGVVHWLRGDALPEREPDGSVLWHGFISDVTERKQAEEALRKSEERFALAMDATSDGLWDWDLATDGGYFSPAYYRMLGYDADSFAAAGRSWLDLIHPDDRELAQRANQDCIDGLRERFEVEYRMKAKDGEWRWILGRGKCVSRDENGRALRMLGTHVDITERKRMQAGLAQSDRLASMGMLAAGIAHEINNPLAYVLANLDTLSQDLPRLVALTQRCAAALGHQGGETALAQMVGPEAELLKPSMLVDLLESAQSALEGTRRIRKISRGLGTFARAERVELSSVDLNHAIETAATMAHNEVKYRARLVKDFGRVPPVHASEGKLAQVFLNLIINAAHAISEGHVERNHITVRTWAEGDQVFAEVKDSGHGIAPENLERIFEPFFTTKQVGLGSGLGLAISRNIITEFGGEIRVESELGVGTRMRVRIPAASSAPVKEEAVVVKAPEPTVRGRILVVDDEEPIRKILVRLLGAQHDVLAVASGREAKALLEQDQAFDVIFCDLMMPEMTGMDLHAWLATVAPEIARRVVFVSGGAFTPTASDYLARVDNLRIEKPFDPAGLKQLASELVTALRPPG